MEEMDLPLFNIVSVIKSWNKHSFIGTFSDTKGVMIGIAYLLRTPDTFIKGRITDLQARENKGTFIPTERADRTLLQVGQSYVYFDGYWGERARLVLEHSRTWQRVAFTPRDAIWHGNDGTTKLVKGGWDHEHCHICWERISQDENPYGYKDQEGTWICEDCYEQRVLPKRLDFIPRS